VDDAATHELVHWGKVNKAMTPEHFGALLERVVGVPQAARPVSSRTSTAGPIRFIDCLFGWSPSRPGRLRSLTSFFVRPEAAALATHVPEFTVIAAPGFEAVPERDGTASTAFILADFYAAHHFDRRDKIRRRNQKNPSSGS
jgi:phosphoenolpyruvate carboxykinase (ATP)